MDRRGFLKSSGAAAALASTAAGADTATPAASGIPSRAGVGPTARHLRLAVAPGYDLAGFGAERLAQRLEVATAGRYRIALSSGAAESDLSFGDAHRHVALHPGFAFFAGLPLRQGLSATDLDGWLALGGGQLLWDELAHPFGLKPLLVGHTGLSPGLWSNVRLAAASDFRGVPVVAPDLAARVLQLLGAETVNVPPQDLKAALATGRVHMAEWTGPLPAASFDLRPLAQCLYQPGLTPGGAVTLTVARRLWDDLTPADRAVFEACAAEEHRLALAEARLHAALAAGIGAEAKWPVQQALPPALEPALAAAAGAVIEEVAGHDAISRRIAASYRAHREVYGGHGPWRALDRPGR